MAQHTNDPNDALGTVPGLEGLRSNAELRGPVEAGEQESHGHLALLYESRAEQFAATIPFVANGLERGERCVYIVEENDTEDVIDALRDARVAVADALDSGALEVRTAAESYLRNGAFDADGMIAFLEETIDDAAREYAGVRITGEMTWAVGDDSALDEIVEYERKLNRVLPDSDGTALCQYNREKFDAALLRDIIETHPYLICDRTVCRNVYYTPPSELFGSDEPEREVERKLGTLRERTEARIDLQDHHEHLRRQNEIAGAPDRSFEEKLQELFELGLDRFDLELGAMARVDCERDRFEVEYVSDDHEYLEPSVELPLSETYCTAAADIGDATSVTDPEAEGFDDVAVYTEFGIRAYLGTYVEIEGGDDRTFFFVGSDRRGSFSESKRTFVRMMGRWVKYELEHEHRDRHQRRLYEIAADPNRTFEEKLDALFELGLDRLDLEFGALTRIDSTTDTVEVEATSGGTDPLASGQELPLSETYCRLTDGAESTTAITDPAGLERTTYEQLGIETYLGTRIELEHGPDRTFFFAAGDAREHGFSDAERTFHHLMAQWVHYELERKHRTQELETSNEHLEQFAHAASHDLQEPLRMVTSYLQLLERRYEGALDEDGEEYLEFAVDGADRMREMIDGLLAYSRVERQGDPFEPTDLEAVVEDVRADLGLQIEEADAEVIVEELPRVMADRSQIRQVLQNLLSNALTYSEGSPRIRVSARKRGSERVVTVADDGIGIAPADQARIFAIFDRLHSRGEYAGSGLGLALCQRIVERHDGELWVDSEPGEGAAFSFTLPAVPEK
ncbi:MEDS domain-containing protein [Natronococcus roseus]|uniref:MEDS domain-containing protein n=1 Tax=Natronococcus roseus TaxID=1052014 RepID=UPI00374C9222